MDIIMGSARHDSRNKLKGDAAGDQTQKLKNGNDFSGEVSMQYLKDFIGSRKWYVIRPKRADHAIAIANSMRIACNNVHLGYDQNQRLGVISNGVDSKVNTECDCSSLSRACVKRGTGVDVGNFTTEKAREFLEKAKLNGSKLFDTAIPYKSGMKIYEGDIIVTQSKGHIGICVEGYSRTSSSAPTQSSFVSSGVDFSKVFDPSFYANSNADIKAALGTNASLLFNHFIRNGCNEKSRYGKTIKTFNVLVYAKNNVDLVNAFGILDDGNASNPYCNGFVFYKHYCEFGYKENRCAV